MPSRSRMAAIGLAASLLLVFAPGVQAGSEPVKNQVKLDLQITGLKRGDCEVHIEPGHAGCQFTKIVKRVRGSGAASRADVLVVGPILAQSTNADRDCAFAITIQEPGEPARTFRRGVRLAPPTAERPMPLQTLTCYITSPSLADRDEAPKRRR